MKTNHWQIAWKRKDESKYRLVDNPSWGWCADPFLVEYKGEIYLFAEIFLYKSERNGVIGHCRFTGHGWTEWTVSMDRHWHLSYPNVWVENDKLYMCPESYQLGEVVIYELEEFPDKWKKVNSLISDVMYCDSTFFESAGKHYMFTYEILSRKEKKGQGLLFEEVNGCLLNKRVISTNVEGNRCGGNVLQCDGKLIRVAQNGKGGYGAGLIFYEIDSLEPGYREHEVKRLYPSDIDVENKDKYIGVHTYNSCGDLEVIDFKYKHFSIEEYFAQKRVRKVFMNKYL